MVEGIVFVHISYSDHWSGWPAGQGRWLACWTRALAGLLDKGAGWPAGKGSRREKKAKVKSKYLSEGAILRREQCFGGSDAQEGGIFIFALSLEGVFWEGVLEIVSRRVKPRLILRA